MPIRVVVTLSPEEAEGLNNLADESLRDRRDQLRWVLRQHLAERGILASSDEARNSIMQQSAEVHK